MTRLKRAFDIGVAVAALPIAAPVCLVIAALIKLDDGGPVLFMQARVGRGGRCFRMWKFRTMRASAEPGLLLTVGEDPRITRVGQWLRRSKLDELPQLAHVLSGTMSLVGPRPEVPEYVAKYTPDQQRVLELVPGITDPASVRYWDEADLLARSSDPEGTYLRQVMPEKIRLQLEYAQEATVWTDVLVVLNTLRRFWPAARPLLLDRLLRHRRPFIWGANALTVVVAYWAAFDLRFEFRTPEAELHRFWITVPLLLAVRMLTNWRFGLHRGYWQHFGLADLITLLKALTVGSVCFALVLFMIGELPGVSRSVLVLEWGAAIFFSGGVRFIARCLREAYPFGQLTGRRTLIIGDGDKAERLVREVRRDGEHPLRVMGLAVDDPSAQNRSIHGVPVVGTTGQLAALVVQLRIDFIVIALDAPTGREMHAVVERCIATRVEFKTLPSLQELLEGSARADQLRTVRLDDLLGRDPVSLDLTQIEADLRGRVVLVTGAAGSIGSELTRQVARFGPARLVLLDQSESPLYLLARELSESHGHLDVVPVICDITDEPGISQVLERERPAYVLHAAAYKHVPMMEDNVAEAVRNNVFGTLLLAENAAVVGAKKFVLISTDKAVNPGSVMGATKRIAERLVLGLPSLKASATDFRAVRFGNVLGSAGSVVPLFEHQLAHGGPITVTHPDVQRYFMTIPEAAQLVLQAAALPGAAGRITMLEMGQPVRIRDLAEKLIRLSGLEPHRDISIVFTGLRPGEKLREELMSSREETLPSGMDKIRIVRTSESDATLEEGIMMLAAGLAGSEVNRLVDQIRALVPECVDPLRSRGRPLAPETAPVLEVAVEL
jgi:FlaA1/EpsC-like NDP-sugar epimerase/lipopolysaccharide/colanic/teichoic acid biosynthesis glycosyltransferase